jgi:hypothetical protein
LYPIKFEVSPPAPSAVQHTYTIPAQKFSYEDYMKTLKSKLELSAPNTNSLSGNSFQQFIVRERQDYMKAVDSRR